MSVTSAPAYPLPRPANNADARFSLALALDVADVLTRHGYPALAAGTDLIRLQQALFGLIYHQNDASDQLLDRPSSIGNQIPLSRHGKWLELQKQAQAISVFGWSSRAPPINPPLSHHHHAGGPGTADLINPRIPSGAGRILGPTRPCAGTLVSPPGPVVASATVAGHLP